MQTGNQNTDPQRLDSIDAECLDNKKTQQRDAKRQEFHALVNTIAESRRNALWLAAREVQRMGSESAGADEPDWDAMPWVAKEFHAARLEADARLAGDPPPTDRPPMAWWEEARLAREARRAEEARLAREARRAEEARLAREARRAEEARLAREARRAEDAKDGSRTGDAQPPGTRESESEPDDFDGVPAF